MARRASKKTNMGMMTGIVAGLLVAMIAIIFVFKGDGARDKGGMADFPIDEFLSRGSLLRDNAYKLSGWVEDRFPRGDGELIVLVVKTPSGTEERLPIIVKQDKKSINIERKQEYDFKVRVVSNPESKGVLYAEDVSLVR